MRRTMTAVLMIICLFVTAAGLSGCGNGESSVEETDPQAVCFAIAPTANAQGLNLNSPLVQDLAYETVLGYGYISVVTIDGSPEVVTADSYDIPEQYKGASKTKLKNEARSKATALLTFLENQMADDPQVDFLEGLRLAARSLSSLEGYKSKTIVVIGTGLSTQGTLDFRNNLLSAEPDTVLDLLEEKEELPDFRDITTVVWQQMGDVASPQTALSQIQRTRLEAIWGGIVERGGSSFVYNDIMANPADSQKEYPEVDVVELPEDTPIAFDMETFEEDEEQENLLEEPVMLTEEQVTFVPDEAVYLDEEEALKTISPVAEYLLRHDEIAILLAGTTAGDDNTDFALKLSQERADTVKDTLVEMGVDESRVTTVGLGSGDPWHVYGAGYEGAAASGNRKVVILDAAGEMAKEILSA